MRRTRGGFPASAENPDRTIIATHPVSYADVNLPVASNSSGPQRPDPSPRTSKIDFVESDGMVRAERIRAGVAPGKLDTDGGAVPEVTRRVPRSRIALV